MEPLVATKTRFVFRSPPQRLQPLLHSRLQANFPFPTDIIIDKDREISNITITGVNDPLSIFLQLAEYFDADNYLWADFGAILPVHRNFTLPIAASFDLWVYSSVIHGTVARWQKLFYDPNFGSLFSGEIPASSTPPSKSKIGKVAVWIPIVIVFGCVIAILITVALVVTFVPAARVLIRPFTQRGNNKPIPRSPEGNRGSGWQRASAPSSAVSNT